MYGEPSISNVARVQRMRWLDHVARVNDDIPTKQASMRGITGRRKRGRPRSKWIQMVERDSMKWEWRKRQTLDSQS
jgi:hypothetical protein